ncbi:MAG: hypothetical protein PHI79_08405 [Sulfurovaceae bacterium]|nr:hypothetical protein [Sulfurovaceae bacterium]MDD5549597.1 hypothetical protein [Sulfurovaceae bacterium]
MNERKCPKCGSTHLDIEYIAIGEKVYTNHIPKDNKDNSKVYHYRNIFGEDYYCIISDKEYLKINCLICKYQWDEDTDNNKTSIAGAKNE